MEEALRPKNFYLNSKAAAASDLRLIPICAYAIACKIRFVEFRKIFINFGAFIKIYKKLFKIFSKVLCDTIPASFRHFYRKIALLFSSKNGKNLHGSLSQIF